MLHAHGIYYTHSQSPQCEHAQCKLLLVGYIQKVIELQCKRSGAKVNYLTLTLSTPMKRNTYYIQMYMYMHVHLYIHCCIHVHAPYTFYSHCRLHAYISNTYIFGTYMIYTYKWCLPHNSTCTHKCMSISYIIFTVIHVYTKCASTCIYMHA